MKRHHYRDTFCSLLFSMFLYFWRVYVVNVRVYMYYHVIRGPHESMYKGLRVCESLGLIKYLFYRTMIIHRNIIIYI